MNILLLLLAWGMAGSPVGRERGPADRQRESADREAGLRNRSSSQASDLEAYAPSNWPPPP